MNISRGFVPLILLMIVGVMALGGAGWWVSQQHSKKLPTTSIDQKVIAAARPTASFTATPTSGDTPLTVTFRSKFVGVGHKIDFGDRTGVVEKDAVCVLDGPCTPMEIDTEDSHTYAYPGTYSVKLSQMGGPLDGQKIDTSTITVR